MATSLAVDMNDGSFYQVYDRLWGIYTDLATF
jgi:hypothetical protein